MTTAPEAAVQPAKLPLRVFCLLFGALLGLSLLKFGNPVILDKVVLLPQDFLEWVLMPWPIRIGHWLLLTVLCVGIFCVHRRDLQVRVVAVLPLLWFCWQLVAATQTVNTNLTIITLRHFATCLACFYLGYLVAGQLRFPALLYLGITCGLGLALAMGLDQHFGGLEQTRKHFWLYVYPALQDVPPELLKRMSSNRIFGTLFYPNSFAGAIVLCLPAVLAFIWSLERYFTRAARAFLMLLFGVAGFACLFWTGSKGGWLVALAVCLVALLHLRFARWVKIGLVVFVLGIGMTAFAVRFTGYFKRGATSAVARFDYWQAAVLACAKNPLFGTGPGTFQVSYAALKRPEAEMARMAHNDYLQQASDSGLPGCALYAVLIIFGLRAAYPGGGLPASWASFGAWLGVLGWCLHNLVEFGLYIPALSWIAFASFGWLIRSNQKTFDKRIDHA